MFAPSRTSGQTSRSSLTLSMKLLASVTPLPRTPVARMIPLVDPVVADAQGEDLVAAASLVLGVVGVADPRVVVEAVDLLSFGVEALAGFAVEAVPDEGLVSVEGARRAGTVQRSVAWVEHLDVAGCFALRRSALNTAPTLTSWRSSPSIFACCPTSSAGTPRTFDTPTGSGAGRARQLCHERAPNGPRGAAQIAMRFGDDTEFVMRRTEYEDPVLSTDEWYWAFQTSLPDGRVICDIGDTGEARWRVLERLVVQWTEASDEGVDHIAVKAQQCPSGFSHSRRKDRSNQIDQDTTDQHLAIYKITYDDATCAGCTHLWCGVVSGAVGIP